MSTPPRRALFNPATPPTYRRRVIRRRQQKDSAGSRFAGSIKRPRLVPPPPPRHAARRHVERVDKYRQLGCSWVGFSSHSRKEVYRCIASYWLSRIVTRCGRPVASHRERPRCFNAYHGTHESSAIERIIFHFREAQAEVSTAASTVHMTSGLARQLPEHIITWNTTAFVNKEFHQLVELLGGHLLEQAEGRGAIQGNNVLSAITVFRRDTVSTDATADPHLSWWFTFDDIEKHRVAFAVTRVHKIQNVTPVVRDGVYNYDPTTLGAVAISGRIYESDRPTPRVQQRFADSHPDYLNLYDQSVVGEDDVALSFTSMRTPSTAAQDAGTATLPADGNARDANPLLPVFSQPVGTPGQIWKGITGTSTVYMAPGGYHVIKRVFTYTGTVKQFTLGISGRMAGAGTYDNNDADLVPRTTTGDCTFVCLEPAIRFADHSKDPLELVINSEYDYQLNIFEPKPYSLPRFNNVMVGVNKPDVTYTVDDHEVAVTENVQPEVDAPMADRRTV